MLIQTINNQTITIQYHEICVIITFWNAFSAENMTTPKYKQMVMAGKTLKAAKTRHSSKFFQKLWILVSIISHVVCTNWMNCANGFHSKWQFQQNHFKTKNNTICIQLFCVSSYKWADHTNTQKRQKWYVLTKMTHSEAYSL